MQDHTFLVQYAVSRVLHLLKFYLTTSIKPKGIHFPIKTYRDISGVEQRFEVAPNENVRVNERTRIVPSDQNTKLSSPQDSWVGQPIIVPHSHLTGTYGPHSQRA